LFPNLTHAPALVAMATGILDNDLGDARDLLGNFGEILGPDVGEVDPL